MTAQTYNYLTTREQDQVADTIASEYGRCAVLKDDPDNLTVVVIGIIDDIELRRWRVLPDGRRVPEPIAAGDLTTCSECGGLISKPDPVHELGHHDDCPLVSCVVAEPEDDLMIQAREDARDLAPYIRSTPEGRAAARELGR